MSEKVVLITTKPEQRADVFISASIEDISRSYVKTLVEKSLVFLNDKPLKKCGESLKIGDKITVEIPDPLIISARPQNLPIDIVYEDEDIIVVNKAQGMVTHPAVGSPDGTLVNALMYHVDNLSGINGVIRPGIVHRLDKDTSGLLVVAKNDYAHNSLATQIAEKRAKRFYIAIVDGNIKEDSGEICKPIGRNPKDRKLMAVVQDGRYAHTLFTVLERFGDYTLVSYQLKTGRTHQIRVHSKSIGHPVIGDEKYGGSNKFGLSGQLLHAEKLELIHPRSGELMTFTAPLPPHFEKVLKKLRDRKKN